MTLKQTLVIATLMATLMLSTFTITCCALVGYDGDDAYNYAVSGRESQRQYSWSYIGSEGTICYDIIYLDIDEDDVRESLSRHRIRTNTTALVRVNTLVDSDDKFVKQIAEEINNLTAGYDTKQRATVALNFVQTAISYESDVALWGNREFWAGPTETLYLHAGDCEDTSILLASILEAMGGIDWHFIDYEDHVAIAAVFEGKEWRLETTSSTAQPAILGVYGSPDRFGMPNWGQSTYAELLGRIRSLW